MTFFGSVFVPVNGFAFFNMIFITQTVFRIAICKPCFPYTIHHASGDNVVKVDQRYNGSEWISLGIFEFAAGTDGYVRLSNDANGYVIADAVKFELQPLRE